MENIKIIFFDIDGTLIDYGTKEITQPVADALNEIQRKGVLLFIATGRPNFYIPQFENVHFDGALSFNGAYCFNEKEAIFSNPLPKEEIQILQENAKKIDKAIAYATSSQVTCDFYQENLDKYFTDACQSCSVSENIEEVLNQDIFQIMIATHSEEDEILMQGIQKLKVTRWLDYATDVIPKNGGKDRGIEKILEYYGIKQEETMAFGDGGNDADMLKYCQIGVAMANGMDSTKSIADYVTKDVKEDGIVHALQHFGLLD